MTALLRRRFAATTVLAYAVLVVVWLLATLAVPGFRGTTQIQDLLQTGAFLGIVAAGQTLVVLMGGIDLSVAGVMALGAVVCPQLVTVSHLNPTVAMLLALLTCLIVGLINGAGIALLAVPPLVMTLAVESVIEGGLLIYTQGSPKGARIAVLDTIANDSLLGIPLAFWIWIAISLGCVWLLAFSRFGRAIHALGTNLVAARLSGVAVLPTTLLAYGLCSLLAGVAGLIIFGYTSSSDLSVGQPFVLNSIAAVVLGGTSILGGRGTYLGTIAGALLLTVITTLLGVWNFSQAGREIVEGALILLLLLAYARERTT